MDTRTAKPRLFVEYEIPTEGGDVLHAKAMVPKPPCAPRRVVFIAPLIGAGAAQSLLTFRNLIRRGAILLSFEYRGHRRSTGTFELDKTVVDVRHALIWASEYAKDMGLPLHGLATCFGVIPLLAQFTGDGCGGLLKSVSATCGLFRLNQIMKLENFAPILSRHLNRAVSAEGLLAGLSRCEFDCDGAPFRHALHEFFNGLFPELNVQVDAFEELSYDRTKVAVSLRQFVETHYLDGVHVPSRVPCHFFYGRNDDLLALDTLAGQETYAKHVRSLVPHAKLSVHDMDHFGRGPDRDYVVDCVGDVWDQLDGWVDLHAAHPDAVHAGNAFGRRRVPR
ncbi:MAG: hypothetical protein U1E05_01800 [Patescibacteria group bacterium]|nr:hypothetical protein [Patescibacteria group bacterium]